MDTRFLVGALAANATFSTLTGIVMLAAAVRLSDWLGIPVWLTVLVGAGLLPFALLVARTARDPVPSKVTPVIVADISWVIGALVILVGFPETMSPEGLWALGVVTVVVGVFSVLQTIGLRSRLRSP